MNLCTANRAGRHIRPNSTNATNGLIKMASAHSMVGNCIAALVLLFAFSAQAEPTYKDSWGGARDHFALSAGIGGAATLMGVNHPMVACMAVGVAKEVADYYKPSPGYRHGLFSGRDLIADAAGCALGHYGVRLIFGKHPTLAYRMEF